MHFTDCLRPKLTLRLFSSEPFGGLGGSGYGSHLQVDCCFKSGDRPEGTCALAQSRDLLRQASAREHCFVVDFEGVWWVPESLTRDIPALLGFLWLLFCRRPGGDETPRRLRL